MSWFTSENFYMDMQLSWTSLCITEEQNHIMRLNFNIQAVFVYFLKFNLSLMMIFTFQVVPLSSEIFVQLNVHFLAKLKSTYSDLKTQNGF